MGIFLVMHWCSMCFSLSTEPPECSYITFTLKILVRLSVIRPAGWLQVDEFNTFAQTAKLLVHD